MCMCIFMRKLFYFFLLHRSHLFFIVFTALLQYMLDLRNGNYREELG